MTARYLLGEKSELQPRTRLPLFCNMFFFGVALFVVISNHKSTTTVRRLRCRRRRCLEASLVQVSHKTHFAVATGSLCVKPQTPKKVDKKQTMMSSGDPCAAAAACMFRHFLCFITSAGSALDLCAIHDTTMLLNDVAALGRGRCSATPSTTPSSC